MDSLKNKVQPNTNRDIELICRLDVIGDEKKYQGEIGAAANSALSKGVTSTISFYQRRFEQRGNVEVSRHFFTFYLDASDGISVRLLRPDYQKEFDWITQAFSKMTGRKIIQKEKLLITIS